MKAGESEMIAPGGGMEGYRFIVEGWDFFYAICYYNLHGVECNMLWLLFK